MRTLSARGSPYERVASREKPTGAAGEKARSRDGTRIEETIARRRAGVQAPAGRPGRPPIIGVRSIVHGSTKPAALESFLAASCAILMATPGEPFALPSTPTFGTRAPFADQDEQAQGALLKGDESRTPILPLNRHDRPLQPRLDQTPPVRLRPQPSKHAAETP